MTPPFDLEIQPQPDDSTCGPTCLHAVYRAHGDDVPLASVIGEIEPLASGGTLAVQLACHALKRGYQATIYTYNLQLFDPTWFRSPGDIPGRLREQAKHKRGARLRAATPYYLEYLSLGGELRFEDLSTDLLRRLLESGPPILTGLSATYLYRCSREHGDETLTYDDVRGEPTGHFVVLYGYEPDLNQVQVADPFHDNPRFQSHYYSLPAERVMGAILLGIVTYDANLLIVTPGRGRTD